ncbi:MAG: glycosyltransferase family 4 protein [Opitutales bacterium]|nr:glycosyltransferase family 4 protein [Opitutales bacterium]
MHICFVSREYPPNPMGGIGTYVANMTRIMAEAGHTVSVLTQAHRDAPACGFDTPHLCNDRLLRVYYLPFVDEAWQLQTEARNELNEALARRDVAAAFGPIVSDALGKLLLNEQIDAIEAPEYEAPLLHFQQMRAALPYGHAWQKVPTIVHLHSPSHMIFEHDDDSLTSDWVRARKADEAQSIELADGILCPSAFLAAQVCEWLSMPKERVSVIPYPIGPLLDYDAATKPQDGLCLFVGRVEPRKGVFEFVQAAVDVAGEFPKARFRFVGGPHRRGGSVEGRETAELIASLIPPELRERFDFAGKVPRETLGNEYARAAFVAVPSRWDNYPNTCMEAMSCARPVLASDQGGMIEMLRDGETGVVAQGKTRSQLLAKLRLGMKQMLTKTPVELEQMGQRARERILRICDDASVIRQHEEYYKEMQTRGKARASRPKAKAGVILVNDGAAEEEIVKAMRSADSQTEELSFKLLAGEPPLNMPAGWTTAGLNTLGGSLPPDMPELPDVLYIGAADDQLPSDALHRALNAFENEPELGLCSMLLRENGQLRASFRYDALHLLSPSEAPERWFFRTTALLNSGGVLANGYFLPDLLRDAVLRLLENGWRGCSLAGNPIKVTRRATKAVIRPFAFHERKDSMRAVALAHPGFLIKDASAIADLLLKGLD